MNGGDSERLEAAKCYAAAGWPVFPCVPGEKVPVTASGFKDASTDTERIASWWSRNPDRNVAIATGAPGPDVLDVDRHESGSGFAAFNRLKREGLVPEPMALVRTPSGGFHAYYRGTEQRCGKLPREHLDYRSQGGYVVAPPSAVSGRPYEVVSHQPSDATFDWGAARQVLDPRPERTPWRDRGADRPRSVEHLVTWMAAQTEGNRDDGLYWAANRALEAGDTETLEALARAALATGLTEREVDKTIRSALRTTPVPFAERGRELEAG